MVVAEKIPKKVERVVDNIFMILVDLVPIFNVDLIVVVKDLFILDLNL